MTGSNVRSFAPSPKDVSLEDLVPEDHSYRCLEARLDLSFVRELVAPLYANGGRTSVDVAAVSGRHCCHRFLVDQRKSGQRRAYPFAL
ncbi:MAG TPA: hypothetical protein VFX77_02865 [Rubrobacter sp.]|nr:hypothetical protein [Rubrobacter sp.]